MPGANATSNSAVPLACSGTTTFPNNLSNSSTLNGPGLKSTGGSTVTFITVDSTPKNVSPESNITSTFPYMSSITCSTLVGLGFVAKFALGAAIGTPLSFIKANATG
uniref:Uncharacterized protein ORF-c09_004 n=1 Tax=Saccharolobus solfataricus TaxID=2287 RepID=Q9UX53_SACSO|nr:hypothetical protein [Saccharolobus solfataricus P2]